MIKKTIQDRLSQTAETKMYTAVNIIGLTVGIGSCL